MSRNSPTGEPLAASVSAVIVTYNAGKRLLETLARLNDQRTRLAEIIVVDNASDDGSLEEVSARHPRVDLVRNAENIGLPASRNIGLGRAASDLVMFVDSDVYLEDGCLGLMLEAMQETGATVVCPRVRLLPERDTVQADGADAHFLGTMRLRNGYRAVSEAVALRQDVGGCTGSCILVDRESALNAGGFDGLYFFYLEDHEFGLRMRALGHRIVCEPNALAFHDRGAGTPGLSFRGTGTYPARRFYITHRNRLLTLLVHYRLRTLIVLSPVMAVYELASFVAALRRGWVREWVRAWRWQFRNTGSIKSRRRRVQSVRVRSDRELLVGGAVPLAPGFVQSRFERIAVDGLGSVLNAYWKLARPLIG